MTLCHYPLLWFHTLFLSITCTFGLFVASFPVLVVSTRCKEGVRLSSWSFRHNQRSIFFETLALFVCPLQVLLCDLWIKGKREGEMSTVLNIQYSRHS